MDSFLSWIGGKKLLRNKINEEFPDDKDFKKYVEVFGGAGWVLFSKDRHALHEVYNDLNSNLVNLFKCVKYHESELQRELNFMINSRVLFKEYLSQLSVEGLTDIQKAARFFYIIKLSYGSKGSQYGAVKKDVQKMKAYIEQIQQRLTNTIIENSSFEKIIDKYDTEETLFYLDPPYHSTEKYYTAQFTKEQHKLLSELLKGLKGKFILSYNDDEYVRRLYKDFKIIEGQRNNNLTSKYKENRVFKELIIKSY